MENLSIEQTQQTPSILFDYSNNYFEMRGNSYPENIMEFYKPIFTWLNEFFETVEEKEVAFTIDLTYFNSGTSRILMEICDLLDQACASFGNRITLNWVYEEDDEDSLDFADMLQDSNEMLIFNLILKEE